MLQYTRVIAGWVIGPHHFTTRRSQCVPMPIYVRPGQSDNDYYYIVTVDRRDSRERRVREHFNNNIIPRCLLLPFIIVYYLYYGCMCVCVLLLILSLFNYHNI